MKYLKKFNEKNNENEYLTDRIDFFRRYYNYNESIPFTEKEMVLIKKKMEELGVILNKTVRRPAEEGLTIYEYNKVESIWRKPDVNGTVMGYSNIFPGWVLTVGEENDYRTSKQRSNWDIGRDGDNPTIITPDEKKNYFTTPINSLLTINYKFSPSGNYKGGVINLLFNFIKVLLE